MLIFVYGTLKEGFPNFHVNRGARVPGEFLTVPALPLHLVSERCTPWLVWQPGSGVRVSGQLFEVGADALAAMDELEGVDDPDGYRRLPIAVQPAANAEPSSPVLQVMAYLKLPQQLAAQHVVSGPHARYTPEMAALYRRRSALRG